MNIGSSPVAYKRTTSQSAQSSEAQETKAPETKAIETKAGETEVTEAKAFDSWVTGSKVIETVAPETPIEGLRKKESSSRSSHPDLILLENALNESGVGSLRGADGRIVREWNLPGNLTPMHVACLRLDEELLLDAISTHGGITCANQLSEGLQDLGNTTPGCPDLGRLDGHSALQFALLNGWSKGASYLIGTMTVDDKLQNTVNETGDSILSLAAGSANRLVVSSLCDEFRKHREYKSYLLHVTADGKNLLHHAARQDDPEVFRYLKSQLDFFDDGGRLPRDGNSLAYVYFEKDDDGKTPKDLVREKVGELHVKLLDDCKDLRLNKLYRSDWENDWERYYVTDYHGNRISWVPLWERCQIL